MYYLIFISLLLLSSFQLLASSHSISGVVNHHLDQDNKPGYGLFYQYTYNHIPGAVKPNKNYISVQLRTTCLSKIKNIIKYHI